ncbi:tRNA (cytidine(34)-2'-O)-methyltransferase [Candidatus Phycosocius bacilliformis]|uniref:tRNA (cytidine(34)-2'-O)-methyltransferase n=1 Tax=Candidatus Phycosocius bacilliformis TaxID=1445552 RepID=A0A2P2EAH2_9PROT|nr:tRNA (cytidine(34)-2'-O)-methyltransferase [Candidatus Phycosocius bacilliformis]GBF58076.1 tRNA (cytidine(34)-2'-O)-methyltransferase [Candidatus Phycosocius bacilliformis]
MRLALFQPDIAPNLGAAIRLTACLGVGLDVIEPCGFPLSDKTLKRAALDYGTQCDLKRHDSFAAFATSLRAGNSRIVLIETEGATALMDFAFHDNDVLMLGRETEGTPVDVMSACHACVRIPMAAGIRSLNVVTAGAIALTEAMRQTGRWAGLA